MMKILGISAFLLLYLDDFNLIYFHKKQLNKYFLLGSILIVITTLINIIANFSIIWKINKVFFYCHQ